MSKKQYPCFPLRKTVRRDRRRGSLRTVAQPGTDRDEDDGLTYGHPRDEQEDRI